MNRIIKVFSSPPHPPHSLLHPRKSPPPPGPGDPDLHMVRELSDTQRRRVRGQSVAGGCGLAIRCGVPQPDEHPGNGSGLVRVQSRVPKPVAESAQEWHVVSFRRSRTAPF